MANTAGCIELGTYYKSAKNHLQHQFFDEFQQCRCHCLVVDSWRVQ